MLDDDEAGELCIFGRGNSEEGGAAFSLAKKGIAVYIPKWPEGKADPDELTKHEVWDILRYTDLWNTRRL